MLSSFFYGYIVTQLPGGYLTLQFGGKNMFGLGIFFTGFFTLLIPVAVRAHVILLVALRIAIGLCEVSFINYNKLFETLFLKICINQRFSLKVLTA